MATELTDFAQKLLKQPAQVQRRTADAVTHDGRNC
jgi:hypothetical protein